MSDYIIDITLYVIIPVYNCKKYIVDTVCSVLNQHNNKIKIILVNDGSTDGSAELCNQLAQNNDSITVIHQKNSGVSSARNCGINHVISLCKNGTTENYIAFLDSDDIWVPGFFDSYICQILKEKYQLIGFQSSYCNSDMSRRAISFELSEGKHKGGNNSIWLHGNQSFAAMFYNVSFLDKYNIRFKDIKYSEDKIFSMQCMYLADSIMLQNKLLYLYRINNNSAMLNRAYGIPYFVPIIDAYLESDEEMKKWKNAVRGELHGGTVLAQVYILDMIDEHFKNFGSSNQIRLLFDKKNKYVKLINSYFKENSNIERFTYMKSHPHQYMFKQRIKGIIFCFIKMLMKNKTINGIIEKRKYTITLKNS